MKFLRSWTVWVRFIRQTILSQCQFTRIVQEEKSQVPCSISQSDLHAGGWLRLINLKSCRKALSLDTPRCCTSGATATRSSSREGSWHVATCTSTSGTTRDWGAKAVSRSYERSTAMAFGGRCWYEIILEPLYNAKFDWSTWLYIQNAGRRTANDDDS